MIKLIVPAVIVTLIFIALVYRFVLMPQAQNNYGAREVPAQVDDVSRLSLLEQTVDSLRSKLGATNSSSLTKPITITSSTDLRITILENSLASLNTRIAKLEQARATGVVASPTTTTTTTVSKNSVYIPLGPGSSGTDLDWTTASLPQVEIDTNNYPGYKNMYLEVFLQLFQGNGTASVRLFNITDGVAVPSSEVSTSSENYVLVSSGAFQITPGKKTYGLQLKTPTGYAVNVQFARIRVDF